VQQRRLTFTAGRKFPGVAVSPRHWLRASPDGTRIAFLMRDDAGVAQLWTVAPTGGDPRQITHNFTGVASAFTWSPDGRSIAHVMDGSVCVTNVTSGETVRLTARREDAAAPSSQACVFSPDGRIIAYTREIAGAAGAFQQLFVVEKAGPPPPR
jgi:dipeptidyl aminopeptidase/acylaminoacyl peptidase